MRGPTEGFIVREIPLFAAVPEAPMADRPAPSPRTPSSPRSRRRSAAGPRSADGAAYAKVGVRTLTERIAKGEIPASKFGPKLVRVDLDDIDALMVPITHGGPA